jgi:hypothetical protein
VCKLYFFFFFETRKTRQCWNSGDLVQKTLKVNLPSKTARVFAGPDSSMALSRAGELVLWGVDPKNQRAATTPKTIPFLPKGEFVEVVASDTELVAIGDDKTLWRMHEGEWNEMIKVPNKGTENISDFKCTAKGVSAVQLGLKFGAAIMEHSNMVMLWGSSQQLFL